MIGKGATENEVSVGPNVKDSTVLAVFQLCIMSWPYLTGPWHVQDVQPSITLSAGNLIIN